MSDVNMGLREAIRNVYYTFDLRPYWVVELKNYAYPWHAVSVKMPLEDAIKEIKKLNDVAPQEIKKLNDVAPQGGMWEDWEWGSRLVETETKEIIPGELFV